MIFRTESTDPSGTITVIEADSDADTVTTTIGNGSPETRSMTTDEAVYFDNQAAVETAEANNATLVQRIEDSIDVLLATVDNLNAITDVANSTMNANPAAYIKDVAREVKTVARQTIDIARVVSGTLDSTDNGA